MKNKIKQNILKFSKKSFIKLFNSTTNLKKNKNQIIFESFNGRQFSDNPKAIYDYIKENHPEFKTYWSVEKKYKENFNFLNEDEIVYKKSLKWILKMNTSKFWITNSRFPNWVKKSKDITYLQTWHGTPLKKLGLDMDEVHMPKTNTEKYKENFIKESSKWDYLVSPNKYSTEIFKRAFSFDKKMIEFGYPRNDFLVKNKDNSEEIKRIKESLKIPNNKKIILYAPTWRDDEFYSVGKYKFDLKLDLEKFKEKLGEDHVIILRLHYLVAENLDLKEYENFVYNFSNHGDIKDLYLISDLLITDYSSVFFDYSILKKPMIFFTYDLEKYRDKLRGFYFDFEKDAPGNLVLNSNELLLEIEKIISNNYKPLKQYQEFFDKFTSLEDGNASKKVVEEVLLKG